MVQNRMIYRHDAGTIQLNKALNFTTSEKTNFTENMKLNSVCILALRMLHGNLTWKYYGT